MLSTNLWNASLGDVGPMSVSATGGAISAGVLPASSGSFPQPDKLSPRLPRLVEVSAARIA